MKFEDVKNHIGDLVVLNNCYDLLFNGELKIPYYRKYIFEIIKITRGGLVYIKSICNKKYYTIAAYNLDLKYTKSIIQNVDYKTIPKNTIQLPSLEKQQELKTYFGIDIEKEMIELLINEKESNK